MQSALAKRGGRSGLLLAVLISLVSAVALAVIRRSAEPVDPLSDLPPTLLWAWERPEDLRFIDVQRTGVAVLVGTVYLSGDRTNVSPRLQPLRLPPDAVTVPVVRIESDPDSRPILDAAQRMAMLREVLTLTDIEGTSLIQIDFDAVTSEREFYAHLIRDLRAALPREIRISITSLASWCLGDPWIAELPISEAVPMLFQMGPDAGDIDHMLRSGTDFGLDLCRTSLGVSTEEPLAARPAGRRTYVFHPESWSAAAGNRAVEEALTWK